MIADSRAPRAPTDVTAPLPVGALDPSSLDQVVDDARTVSKLADARPHRRLLGQVFTPPRLAGLVAHEVLAPLVGGARTVLDPACGDGAFLAAVADVAARLAIPITLVGIERDPALAAACRARLPVVTVHEAEALLSAPDLPLVDAVVANPPYLRSVRLKAGEPALWAALRGRFLATSHGEWDLYGAFLERALTWVRPGGRVGMITPSRWLTAAWARPLRAHLAGAVRTVIDFGAAQVFADATTYAAVTIYTRPAAPATVDGEVARLVRRGPAGWQVRPLRLPCDGGPWRGDDERGPEHRTLGDVARIAKGAGTNADPVFVLVDAAVDGALVHGRGPDGAPVVLEAEATRPCWRGRDIQDGAAGPRARCLLPYDGDRLIPWATLRARWPRAAAYLEAHRARLEARERGRFVGDRFHAFGRPQNLAFLLDPRPKVLVPDVCRAPRAVLDRGGALVLDTAYALRPLADAPPPWDDIDRLHALMRSPAVPAWLAEAGAPLRGDYRRWKTAYLAPMPLP